VTGNSDPNGIEAETSQRDELPTMAKSYTPQFALSSTNVIPTGAQRSGGTCSCLSLRVKNLSCSESATTHKRNRKSGFAHTLKRVN